MKALIKKRFGPALDLFRNAANGAQRRLGSFVFQSEPSAAPAIQRLSENQYYDFHMWNHTFRITYLCNNTNFIHIGKCGGTSIIYKFLTNGLYIKDFHLRKPVYCPKMWYFFWIRNPLHRFVSAFNYAKEILDFNLDLCDVDKISLDTCPAPQKIKHRFEHGFAFEPMYDALVRSFSSANELAESISSRNANLRARAIDLMHSREEHILKGLGWYLDDGAFVNSLHRQIFFVGRLEKFDTDFQLLQKRLELPFHDLLCMRQKRKSKSTLPRDLSPLAIRNLRVFYAKTDYKALNALKCRGFITQGTFDAYHEYYYPES